MVVSAEVSSLVLEPLSTATSSSPSLSVPVIDSFWQYIVFIIVSGGGVAAIKQFLGAYKEYKETKADSRKSQESNRDAATQRVVELLQNQLDSVVEDYQERLNAKDRYYQGVLEVRKQLADQNLAILRESYDHCLEENEQLRKELKEAHGE